VPAIGPTIGSVIGPLTGAAGSSLGSGASVAGVLGALLLGGMGAPLPEDAALLVAGYLVWRGDAPVWLLAPACLLSIVICDATLYGLGRLMRKSRRVAARLERLSDRYRRHGGRLVLLGRVAIGVRPLFFLAAGLSQMRLVAFLGWDLLGAAFMTALWITVGRAAGPTLDGARGLLDGWGKVVLLVLAACVLAKLSLHVYRAVARRTNG
jgi:membrane protein DedA with SNARE-associated domain